jgi:hypothetical protein
LADTTQKTSTLFTIWVQDVSKAYDALESDMIAQIGRMRALGLSDSEIFTRLSESLESNTDIFSTFKGSVGRGNDTLVNMVSQVESNESIGDMAEMWIWELDPTAKDHCEDCLANSEKGEMPFSEWSKIGLPGYGNTECGKYCRCTLTPIE